MDDGDGSGAYRLSYIIMPVRVQSGEREEYVPRPDLAGIVATYAILRNIRGSLIDST